MPLLLSMGACLEDQPPPDVVIIVATPSPAPPSPSPIATPSPSAVATHRATPTPVHTPSSSARPPTPTPYDPCAETTRSGADDMQVKLTPQPAAPKGASAIGELRNDRSDGDLDGYATACHLPAVNNRFTARVLEGGCSGSTYLDLGSMTLLGDHATLYAHQAIPSPGSMPGGKWEGIWDGPTLILCGQIT